MAGPLARAGAVQPADTSGGITSNAGPVRQTLGRSPSGPGADMVRIHRARWLGRSTCWCRSACTMPRVILGGRGAGVAGPVRPALVRWVPGPGAVVPIHRASW